MCERFGADYRQAMKRPRLLLLLDVVVVAALALTALAQVWQTPEGEWEGGRAVHSVLVAAFTLPLLVRRRFAATVFVTVVAAAWVQLELGGGLGQPFFAVVIGLYSAGAHAPAPQTFVGPAAIALHVVFVDVPRLRDGDPVDEVVPAWFVLVGIWAFGRWMRRRARESLDLTERAEAAERDLQAQAARAVAEERARIARELHDLVAHSMGVIVIQAQGAQRAIATAPEQARASLASIEAAGRTGMAEMRRLLGLLTPTEEDAGTTPQPTLKEIPDLVANVRDAGLHVDLTIEGTVRDLPPGVELTGFRVVQEAMTNVLKHAGTSTVEVRISYQADCLEIEVRDRGSEADHVGAPADRGGHGLVGMRERVGLYGGTLRTGLRPDGQGFAVHARLPLDGRPT
jgi:signal transduction histidine kinase